MGANHAPRGSRTVSDAEMAGAVPAVDYFFLHFDFFCRFIFKYLNCRMPEKSRAYRVSKISIRLKQHLLRIVMTFPFLFRNNKVTISNSEIFVASQHGHSHVYSRTLKCLKILSHAFSGNMSWIIRIQKIKS